MSTRATYLFNNTALAGEPICVYIHHDGYPMGAAEYFRKAMNEKMDGGKPLLEAFITANDGALITRNHEAHGDTEYRYTTDGKNLQIEKREIVFNNNGYKELWFDIYNGDLHKFVVTNLHLQEAVA